MFFSYFSLSVVLIKREFYLGLILQQKRSSFFPPTQRNLQRKTLQLIQALVVVKNLKSKHQVSKNTLHFSMNNIKHLHDWNNILFKIHFKISMPMPFNGQSFHPSVLENQKIEKTLFIIAAFLFSLKHDKASLLLSVAVVC